MSSKGRAVQGARTHSGSGKGGQKSFPLGRVCGQCGDPLSQYNPGPNCWNHTVQAQALGCQALLGPGRVAPA
jgi:hypothetical protein